MMKSSAKVETAFLNTIGNVIIVVFITTNAKIKFDVNFFSDFESTSILTFFFELKSTKRHGDK